MTLKRLFALLMAVAMVFCLAACGGDAETGVEEKEKNVKKTLVGDWEAEVDLSDMMAEMLADELGMEIDVDDFAITMALTFEDDGTFKAEMKADWEEAVEDLVDNIWDYILETTAEEAGMSVSEVEELMEEQGVTKDMLMEEVDMEDIMGDLEEKITGEWVLDGDKLYMAEENPEDEEPVIIDFDGGDVFTIEEMGDIDVGYGEMILPLEFERV